MEGGLAEKQAVVAMRFASVAVRHVEQRLMAESREADQIHVVHSISRAPEAFDKVGNRFRASHISGACHGDRQLVISQRIAPPRGRRGHS